MMIVIAMPAALVLTACAHRQNGDYWAGVSAGVAHVEKQK